MTISCGPSLRPMGRMIWQQGDDCGGGGGRGGSRVEGKGSFSLPSSIGLEDMPTGPMTPRYALQHPSLNPPRHFRLHACRSDSGAASFLGGLWEAVRLCQQDGWKVASIPQVWTGCGGLVVGPGVDWVWAVWGQCVRNTVAFKPKMCPEGPSPNPLPPQHQATNPAHVACDGQYMQYHPLPASSIRFPTPSRSGARPI